MFGFRKSVLEFQAEQLRINAFRQQITDAHQQTFAAMSERIARLERQVSDLQDRRR